MSIITASKLPSKILHDSLHTTEPVSPSNTLATKVSSSESRFAHYRSMPRNTVFLALGAAGQPITRPYGWLKSFTSIVSFLLGCYVFAKTRFIRPKA
ncbi:hypothetical protein HYFRA_00007999 [Hymenoscyphus fraxineus]|uniref:Uncharacterized protein n=1 Tax=Hymenoscyphus fraxineus TaxID=746836 RepID=A0A9N9KQ01_9HELO|nr:hypothetical protein HYFRA_00007999 [Hymenoscyphus fraxineus]